MIVDCPLSRFVLVIAITSATFSVAAFPTRAAEPRPGRAGEAIDLLVRYLSIDTVNPPGHERAGVEFLREILDREGISTQVFDLGGGRANLMAVYPGEGTPPGRPLVLLHHIDVVPADPEHWSTPPLQGTIKDGRIYGRGALDIKGKGIIDLMTLISFKREGRRFHRDLVFLAVADEEAGGLGSRWIREHRPPPLDRAQILLDEGGVILVNPPPVQVPESGGSRVSFDPVRKVGIPDPGEDRTGVGSLKAYMVSVAEKTPVWLRLTATGPTGHGSVPIPGSALERLLQIAARVREFTEPPRVHPHLKEFIALLLEGKDLSTLPGYSESFDKSIEIPEFLEAIAEDPKINACLRSTLTLTQLEGSDKINTIANQATLGLDCRLLPGVNPKEFVEKLLTFIGDPRPHVEIIGDPDPPSAPPSPVESPFLAALGTVARSHEAGARVIPYILLASTDAIYFRDMGMETYGFEPYRLTQAEYDLSHGNDEYLSVKNVGAGIELLREILLEIDRLDRAGGERR